MRRSRVQALALQAWRRIEVLGHDPVGAIAWAIERATGELVDAGDGLDRHTRGMRRALVVVNSRGSASPAEVAEALGTLPKVAWTYLQRLVKRRLVRRAPGGRYARARGPRRPPSSDGDDVSGRPVTIASYARDHRLRYTTAAKRLATLVHRGRARRIGLGCYVLGGDARPVAATSARSQGSGMTVDEFAHRHGLIPGAAQKRLARQVRRGTAIRLERGRYLILPTVEPRSHAS